jgi:hypothetical protein
VRTRLHCRETHWGRSPMDPATRSETEDEGCRIVIGQGGLESGTPSAILRFAEICPEIPHKIEPMG